MVKRGESGEAELKQWWTDVASEDSDAVVPKAIEYGSRDLEEMGHSLARVADRVVTRGEAQELGCWFYALGKMARWTAAVERGESVSLDTLIDLGTYITMVRRIRDIGYWPGTEL